MTERRGTVADRRLQAAQALRAKPFVVFSSSFSILFCQTLDFSTSYYNADSAFMIFIFAQVFRLAIFCFYKISFVSYVDLKQFERR